MTLFSLFFPFQSGHAYANILSKGSFYLMNKHKMNLICFCSFIKPPVSTMVSALPLRGGAVVCVSATALNGGIRNVTESCLFGV